MATLVRNRVSARSSRLLARAFAPWSLLLCAALAFSSSAVHAAPVTVRLVWSAADARDRAETAALIEHFHSLQVDVRVEALPRLWLGYDIQDSYVRFLSLQDPSVDIYLLDTPWIPAFARPGWLLPLDEAMTADELGAFLPSALEGARHDGHVWGLPRSSKGNALLYRRDLLEQAGIAVPRSLDELDRAARALRRAGKVHIGVALHGMFLRNDVFPMFWASGCELLPDAQQPGLRAPACAAVLTKLRAMSQGDDAAIPPDLLTGPATQSYGWPEVALRNGDAAFAITWSGRLAVMEAQGSAAAGKLGVAAIPGLRADAPGASNLGTWYFAISRASRHPEAALQVVRFLASAEAARLRMDGKGELPAVRSVAEDAKVRAANPGMAETLAVLATGRNRARIAAERDLGVAVERAIVASVRDGRDPTAALAEAATAIETLVADEAGEVAEATRVAASADADLLAPPTSPTNDTVPWTGAFAALLLLGLLLWSERRRHNSLATRLSVAAGLLAATLLVLAITVATQARLQAIEAAFARQEADLHTQLQARAAALGKSLALSAALLLDIEGVDSALPLGVTLGRDKPAAASMRQLLLAGRFHDDVEALDVLDRDGSIVLSAEDALFVDIHPVRTPVPAMAARIGQRRPSLQMRLVAGVLRADLLLPIFREGRLVGGLRVQTSGRREAERLQMERQEQQAATARTLWMSALGLLVLVLAAALAARSLAVRIGRPLQLLAGKSRQVGDGELDVRFDTDGADEIARLGAAMNDMVQGLRQREQLRDALDAYVSPEVAAALAARPGGLDLPGEERTIAVLMADLRGFSTWSRALGAERTIALLNRTLGALTDEVLGHGGTVAELLGDAVLAMFGAPVIHDDDPRRAVAAAVAMVRRLDALGDELQADGLPRLAMGVGIDIGPAIVGSLGGGKRRKYGAVGDVMSRAARIESLTGRGQVLIGAALRQALGDDVEVDGPLQAEVKGSGSLEVFDVRGVRLTDGSWARLDTGPTTPARRCDEVVTLRRYEGKSLAEAEISGRIVGEAGHRLWVVSDQPVAPFTPLLLTRGGAALQARVRRFVALDDATTLIVDVTAEA